jgi:hypothetical protein
MEFRIKNDSDRKVAETFLTDLANLLHPAGAQKLVSKFEGFFPTHIEAGELAGLRELVSARALEAFTKNVGNRPEKEVLVYLLCLGNYLRCLWDAPDLHTAAWQWFWLRAYGAIASGYHLTVLDPPPPSPFEGCMRYLWSNLHRAGHCSNPDCPAPYYFGTKKGQQYCSEDCAEYGQREAKKRWWTEHGEKWRKGRKAKSKTKKGKK